MAADFLISLSFIQASIESSQAKINNDATKLMTTVASISASVQMQQCLAVRLHKFMKYELSIFTQSSTQTKQCKCLTMVTYQNTHTNF